MLKKIFFIFLIFFVSQTSVLAIEDTESVSVQENDEIILEPEGFLDENIFSTEEEDFLVAPEEAPKKLGVEVVDVNKPLLEDHLRFEFERGPVESLTFFGAYQGGISANFINNNYSTEYENGFADVGAVGKFRDGQSDFKFMFNTRQLNNLKYLQGFLSDNYIATNKIPHHRLLVGNSRTPIGMEGGASSYTLPFINRSQISRNFGSIRAFGTKLVGDFDLVEYNLGLYSSDRYFREFFPGVEFTGWVNLKPLGKTDGKYGKLVVGGGLNAGKNDTTYTVGGAYAGYEYKKFSANFECAIADGYNGPVQSQNKASGFYSTVAYKITPKLQLLARFDQFDPNRDFDGDMRREYTAGLNYYIRGEALRLILNYVFYENENQQNGNRIFFATQILL